MWDAIIDAYNAMPMWAYWAMKGYVALCLVGSAVGIAWQVRRNAKGASKRTC